MAESRPARRATLGERGPQLMHLGRGDGHAREESPPHLVAMVVVEMVVVVVLVEMVVETTSGVFPSSRRLICLAMLLLD